MDANQISAAIERAKRAIIEDVVAGIVPATCANFSELHDYVDANEYGGACDADQPFASEMSEEDGEAFTAAWNKVKDTVSEWIEGGALRRIRSANVRYRPAEDNSTLVSYETYEEAWEASESNTVYRVLASGKEQLVEESDPETTL